ncbi:MAG: TRAP transporter large permease [Clostridiales bacterium]|jgi:tripartite ATP-independent transporter DctM subunit|nr:TRAP transporter large permease [Bacillota bacterium]NLL54476.1 TRAP transporter large permease [Clostridiales bacterium]
MGPYIPMILTFILLILGIPVAVSFFSGAIIYFTFFCRDLTITTLIQKMLTSGMSFTFLAVPFFVTAGVVMNYAGISDRVMGFCNNLVGHKRGGLAYVNVLLSTLNGGICGSAGADAANDCKILVPQMVKRGYSPAFSAGVSAASALISPIIPPGAGLILYASMTGTSVVKMYYAGYIPGILLCIGMCLTVAIIARVRHFTPDRESRATLKEILQSLKESWLSLMMPLVLIVGIRTGWFTPTEGGLVLISMCALIGAFAYKEIKPCHIKPILVESFSSMANVSLIIVSAVIFGTYLSWERIPQNLAAYLISITDSPGMFLLLANLLVFVMGMFLDGTAVLMIATPLLFPAAQSYGIDPIQFGIIMIVNMSVGGLTPPFGGVMYLCCHMCNVEIPDFLKHTWPFIVCLLIVLVLVTCFPIISTLGPDLLY